MPFFSFDTTLVSLWVYIPAILVGLVTMQTGLNGVAGCRLFRSSYCRILEPIGLCLFLPV